MNGATGPLAHYRAACRQQGFTEDPAQLAAVHALQRVYDELLATPPRRLALRRQRWHPVRGLYLWGGVGRGKTFLMDAFHDALPFSARRRTHFHRFMLEVHERRRAYADQRDPIARVAEEIAERTRVLCFDEFFVADIADAMILDRLTEVLFDRGVTLVATSNVHPDALYRDGLQRERFLPAIARIKRHCEVLHLDSPTDYRLRALTHARIHLHPCDEAAMQALSELFSRVAPDAAHAQAAIRVNGREIPVLRIADGIVWCDFEALCVQPRGAADYIEIAREFHTVIVSGIPVMDASMDDAARRFITMVDEFYDRNVKLAMASAAPAASLYRGERLAFEFQRTVSRLTEMASEEYLARPHLP